jgi:hypothetical protein
LITQNQELRTGEGHTISFRINPPNSLAAKA